MQVGKTVCGVAIAVAIVGSILWVSNRKWKSRQDGETGPSVVTEDIQAGIERHIEEQSRANNGYFELTINGKRHALKLVRVHTEYLANLGPRRHFACVDLADTKGDVYDVDFFLQGDPGAMTVTETTTHKLNGQPFYLWKQKWNKTWVRVPAKNASKDLLGVITSPDEFEFRYLVRIPALDSDARMWIPLPVSDSYQDIRMKTIKAPTDYRILEERSHGNQVIFFELTPRHGDRVVDIVYSVRRVQKGAYKADPAEARDHLGPEGLVPAGENFRMIAEEALAGKRGELVRARALYDHVIDRMRYMKHGPGWGKGDAVYACDAATGNCSDYHSYFIAVARAAGIPARFAVGAAVPSARNDGGISGYHCWAEFYAEGKWWPVDISEADKYTSLATYYFGHHPANRIEFTRGRDLVVEPGPVSGPINFLAYPVLEIGGKLARVKPTLSFKRTSG